MYAIIRDRGREYRVQEGDIIKIDSVDMQKGDSIEFDEVLLYSSEKDSAIGQPLVSGAKVTGEVVGETKGR